MTNERTPCAVLLDKLVFHWPRANAPCLQIDHLSIGYGERVFVHGPSGCGKSTLLSLIAGVTVPTEGRITVLGNDFHTLCARDRDEIRADDIGYVFQQFNLLSYLSVIDNVILPCLVSNCRARRAIGSAGSVESQAQRLLCGMGIGPDLWRRQASALSVGQQQRVATARALMGSPSLLIFDEPTSALDAPMRDTFMTLVLEAADRERCSLLFVSHDEELAHHFERYVPIHMLNLASRAEAAA